jgi:DNA-binding HxlR family transcriptional regulator
MISLNGKTYTCPVDVTLGLVGGKWKLIILFHLYYFTRKSYTEIKDNLPRISEKMLWQQLNEMERDQLISKQILSAKPRRVEYTLTEKGKSLAPVYETFSKWGIEYLQENGIDYIQDQHLYK